MSYEGYDQFLCKNGHHWTEDAYTSNDKGLCRICGESIIWENCVDITNGTFDDDGTRIDGYVKLRIKRKAKYEKCKCCENKKLIQHETYCIPKKVRN